MKEKALKQFQWFPEPTHLTGDKKKERHYKESTLWYHPTETEYHKWLTVKKLQAPNSTQDTTKGYGLYAKRKFYTGDILSIYLGEYIEDRAENIYTLGQMLPGGM